MSSTAANGTATTGDGTTGTVKATPVDNSAHEAIASWFLGPKAENVELLRRCFDKIVLKQYEGRQAYFPEDSVSVLCFRSCCLHGCLIHPFIVVYYARLAKATCLYRQDSGDRIQGA